MILTECNYEIYNKKLLIIIQCFEQWWSELEETDLSVKILTDHKSLEYFMKTKKLTQCQTQWAEFLSQYNFIVIYWPEKQNEKADLLIRHSEDLLKDEQNERQQIQYWIILTSNWVDSQLQKMTVELSSAEIESNVFDELNNLKSAIEQVLRTNWENSFCQKILNLLCTKVWNSKKISLSDCEEIENNLHYWKKLWILKETQLIVLQKVHNHSVREHSEV